MIENKMTEEKDLKTLIDYFGRGYRYFPPSGIQEERDLLRSLLNVRSPGPVEPGIAEIQNRYLRKRLEERGIVDALELPTVKASLGSDSRFSDRISLWQGDITLLRIGAIVNAANSRMLGCFVPMHACIDNCIHTYAGIQLREDCHRRMESYKAAGNGPDWPTAIPMVTEGYNLPAGKVIHVVGPIVQGEVTEQNRMDLGECYSSVLDVCEREGIRSVAFCCISTGVFRFPNRLAADIAVRTVREWLCTHPDSLDRVVFNVFKDEDLSIYRGLLS